MARHAGEEVIAVAGRGLWPPAPPTAIRTPATSTAQPARRSLRPITTSPPSLPATQSRSTSCRIPAAAVQSRPAVAPDVGLSGWAAVARDGDRRRHGDVQQVDAP